MSDVVKLITKGPRLPEDFALILRKLADEVESGEITEFVAAYKTPERYEYLWPSSLEQSILLTSMLQHRACARMGCGTPDHTTNL